MSEAKESFYQRLDRMEQEGRIERIFKNRPADLHDYQGCANDEARASAQPVLNGGGVELPPLPKPIRTSEFWDRGIDWPLAGERAARLERERQLIAALTELIKAKSEHAPPYVAPGASHE